MKNILYILSLVLLSTVLCIDGSTLSAQTVYRSSGSKSRTKKKNDSKFDVHKIVVGGNLGFSGTQIDNNTTYSFFSVTPMVGYQVANFDYAGISLGYQYSRYKFKNYYNPVTNQQYTYKLVLPTYYFGLWNHLFVIPQVFISTELLFTTYKYADGTTDLNTGELERFTESAPSVIFGAGYAGRQSSNQKVWYAFWINYDLLQHPNSPYYSDNDFFAGLFYKAGFFIRL